MNHKKIINPRFLAARRRAARYQSPRLQQTPALRPEGGAKVDIGILRDPARPIELHPAVHLPRARRRIDRYDVIGGLAIVGLCLIFFGVI